MQTLEVSLLAADVVIGSAMLSGADPGMGVAWGIFHPGEFYRPEEHASFLGDRVLFDIPGRIVLTALDGAGTRIECAGVLLTDYGDTLGPEGREIEILGMEEYRTHFG